MNTLPDIKFPRWIISVFQLMDKTENEQIYKCENDKIDNLSNDIIDWFNENNLKGVKFFIDLNSDHFIKIPIDVLNILKENKIIQ